MSKKDLTKLSQKQLESMLAKKYGVDKYLNQRSQLLGLLGSKGETDIQTGFTGPETEALSIMFENVNKAEGGLTEMVQEDVTTETITEPTRPMPMQVTYDQLRARLPKEIGDEIVNLLANSYEALADFASIATQADVDNFNSKYGVELVLPQEA